MGPLSQNQTSQSRRQSGATSRRPKHRRNDQAQGRIPKGQARPTAATARPVPPPAVVHRHAAALDVHSDHQVVGVGPHQVETFGADTVAVHAGADDRHQPGVTSVVREATGVYGVPLVEWLESRGFEVLLIEPSPARHGGARPTTDVWDCQGLQRLHTFGLRRPSFRPPESVRALRGSWRQRQLQVRDAASHVPHIHKALEQMQVKLTEVAADLMGPTGTRIIPALRHGERHAHPLARRRDPSCHQSPQEYAKALEGTWRPEQRCARKQALAV